MHDLALPSSRDASGAGDACLFGLSLCSGAGGLDLGLTIAIPGYRTEGNNERDAYASAILVARMEDAALDQAVFWDDLASLDALDVVDFLSWIGYLTFAETLTASSRARPAANARADEAVPQL